VLSLSCVDYKTIFFNSNDVSKSYSSSQLNVVMLQHFLLKFSIAAFLSDRFSKPRETRNLHYAIYCVIFKLAESGVTISTLISDVYFVYKAR